VSCQGVEQLGRLGGCKHWLIVVFRNRCGSVPQLGTVVCVCCNAHVLFDVL
jgi:hypothetical protein